MLLPYIAYTNRRPLTAATMATSRFGSAVTPVLPMGPPSLPHHGMFAKA